MKTVDSPSLNSSACTTTPGLGRPSSLGTTTRTTSPRFTSSRSNHTPSRSRHRWRRFPDAAPSILPVGVNQLEPWDCANPAPNAAPAAAPARATARGVLPCAAADCGVLPFSGSWPRIKRNMLRDEIQRLSQGLQNQDFPGSTGSFNLVTPSRHKLQLSTFSAAMNASCGMSTLPNCRIFFLPSFCFSRSFRLRVMSPP